MRPVGPKPPAGAPASQPPAKPAASPPFATRLTAAATFLRDAFLGNRPAAAPAITLPTRGALSPPAIIGEAPVVVVSDAASARPFVSFFGEVGVPAPQKRQDSEPLHTHRLNTPPPIPKPSSPGTSMPTTRHRAQSAALNRSIDISEEARDPITFDIAWTKQVLARLGNRFGADVHAAIPGTRNELLQAVTAAGGRTVKFALIFNDDKNKRQLRLAYSRGRGEASHIGFLTDRHESIVAAGTMEYVDGKLVITGRSAIFATDFSSIRAVLGYLKYTELDNIGLREVAGYISNLAGPETIPLNLLIDNLWDR